MRILFLLFIPFFLLAESNPDSCLSCEYGYTVQENYTSESTMFDTTPYPAEDCSATNYNYQEVDCYGGYNEDYPEICEAGKVKTFDYNCNIPEDCDENQTLNEYGECEPNLPEPPLCEPDTPISGDINNMPCDCPEGTTPGMGINGNGDPITTCVTNPPDGNNTEPPDGNNTEPPDGNNTEPPDGNNTGGGGGDGGDGGESGGGGGSGSGDNNNTDGNSTCPIDYYYSTTEHRCVSFYDNGDGGGNGDNGGNGDSGGGGGGGSGGDGNNTNPTDGNNTDGNGTEENSTVTFQYNGDKLNGYKSEYENEGKGAVVEFINKKLDNYFNMHRTQIPNFTGNCQCKEFDLNFNIFDKTINKKSEVCPSLKSALESISKLFIMLAYIMGLFTAIKIIGG